MQKAPDRQTPSESSRAEAERQLVASAERHREVVASMRELGVEPGGGPHVSVKSVGRAFIWSPSRSGARQRPGSRSSDSSS
jgi:hypothetical protein